MAEKKKRRGVVRVLAIDPATKKDAEGRTIGSDWLLADMGEGDDGKHYYVTTDCVHASELGGMSILRSRELAEYVVEKVNGEWFRFLRRMEKKREEAGAHKETPPHKANS